MDIARFSINGKGCDVPAILISPSEPIGSAVIAHGYGGCKEEQLGLAWRIAESGIAACSIDLRGHGQHPLPLDDDVIEDIEAAIEHCHRFGKVVAIGHSLGGRLSLICGADFAIGISPPLDPTYCPRTQDLLEKLRSYRVRPNDPNVVFGALERMPLWRHDQGNGWMIIYGSRDVPEIVASCDRLRVSGANAIRIEEGLHSDTYLLEMTFEKVVKQLKEWFGPSDGRS